LYVSVYAPVAVARPAAAVSAAPSRRQGGGEEQGASHGCEDAQPAVEAGRIQCLGSGPVASFPVCRQIWKPQGLPYSQGIQIAARVIFGCTCTKSANHAGLADSSIAHHDYFYCCWRNTDVISKHSGTKQFLIVTGMKLHSEILANCPRS
jgi:hypothetical protein